MVASELTVVVLGGGYTGVTVAVDLARNAPTPLDIRLVEPRDEVGRGVAYSAKHPDHRLNAPTGIHYIIPEEPDALDNWFHTNIGLEKDPDAEAFDGSIFIRRWDFGSYVNYEFKRHRRENPSQSTLSHITAQATDVIQKDRGFRVSLDAGEPQEADAVIVTTSNDKPSIPYPLSDELSAHPALISDPWDVDAIETLPPDSKIMIVGTGLTAADVIAALMRKKHQGPVTAISRRGYLPTSRPKSHAGLPQPLWERVHRDPSLFTAKHGRLLTARAVLHAVREDAAKAQAEGYPWQMAFDDLRDSAQEVWQSLPLDEQKRAIRHAGALYDIHRFRYPPQTEDQLKAAEAIGMLKRRKGDMRAARDKGDGIEIEWHDKDANETICQTYDAVISCVGPETRPHKTGNPLLHAMLERGLARPSPLERGLDVDGSCRIIGEDGSSIKGLFAMGPLTFAQFFWSLGVPFIMPHIRAGLPNVFSDLGIGDKD